ncbi:hypothetical protein BUALT_Bualt17G0033400 [Buddleja alternifolia]|uniref:HNH homing endonuclease n=1 Tax=Buddleja alternifolia TaxID=168488 RepID=A0AAV6WC11_9LAMI|nr:hypothetical protein BUALT_Bualt17G0033400 [Buddleja alternifolia]
MEGKNNKNFNQNYGQRHRARYAYEVYELEHMLHTFHKVSGYYNHAKPHYPDKVSNDHFENGREMKHYWRPTIHDTRPICNVNIDDEADEFIELKHEKFKRSNF